MHVVPGVHVRTAFSSDSAILLDRRNGRCYSLGPIETRVWKVLLSGQPIMQAVSSIAEEYGQPEPTISSDVQTFLEQMVHVGICARFYSSGQPSKGSDIRNMIYASYHLLRAWFILNSGGFKALDLKTRCFRVAISNASCIPSIENLIAVFQKVVLFDLTDARCLQHSAALTCFLRGNGIPAECVIGIKVEPFVAHAWVELNGMVVAGTTRRSSYVAIDRL